MIQEIITPILYFGLFCLLIARLKYFRKSTIPLYILLIGFSLKAISAILFGYLFRRSIITGGDTYLYVSDAQVIFQSLFKDPLTFLQLTFGSNDFHPVPAHLTQYTDAMHFWFDSSNYFVVRLNAIICLFSFGVYNVHALFFAFLSFIGTYNLYLFFEDKVYNKKVLQFILFGIPSIVFWTSGVHKEAIVIFSLGLILNNLGKVISGSYSGKNILVSVIGLIVLGYIRVYLLAFLIPLAAAITIYHRFEFKKSSLHIYIACIAGCLFGLALLDHFIPRISFLHEFFVRRAYFLHTIPGHSTFSVISSPNNYQSCLSLIWEALTNPFLRPLPQDCSAFLTYLASFETYLLLFTFIGLLFTINIKSLYKNPYAVFCILYSLSTLFLIGLIVNNSGAIVRYRSIAIPFLLIGLCLSKRKAVPATEAA